MIDRRRRHLVLSGSAAVLSAAAPVPGWLCGTAQAAEDRAGHRVRIRSFRFEPAVLEVRAGNTVTWTNEDLVPHTATATDRSWDTGRIEKGKSVSIVITEDMTVDYFCHYHPAMKARIAWRSEG